MTDVYTEGEQGDVYQPEPEVLDPAARRRAAIEALQNAGQELQNAQSESASDLSTLGRGQRQRELDTLIATDVPVESKLPALAGLQAREAADSVDDAQLGYANALSSESGQRPLSFLDYQSRKADAVEMARSKLEALRDRQSTAGLGVAGGLVAAGEFAEQTILPTATYARFTNAMSKVAPELPWSYTGDLAGTVKKFQTWLTDPARTTSELDTTMASLQDVFEKDSGVLTKGGYEFYSWVQILLENIDDKSPNMQKAENLFAALDIVGLAAAGRGLVKGAQLLRGTLTSGSVAATAARSPEGLRRVLKVAASADSQKSAGVAAGAAFDDAVAPRIPGFPHPINGDIAPLDVAPIESVYLTPTEVDAVKAKAANLLGGVRGRDSVIMDHADEAGFDITLRTGNLNGAPLETRAAAIAKAGALGLEPESYQLVRTGPPLKPGFAAGPNAPLPDGSGWLIEQKNTVRYTLSDGDRFDPSISTGSDLLGKTRGFTNDFVVSGTRAAIRTEAEAIAQTKTLKPYSNLTGARKAAVNSLLEEDDGVRWMDTSQLAARWGSGSDDMMAAYKAAQKVSERNYDIVNARARQSLEADGFKWSVPVGDGVAFLRATWPVVGQEVFDLVSGQVRKLRRKETGTFYEIFGKDGAEVEKGRAVTHAFVSDSQSVKLERLPQEIVRKRPGHIQRVNNNTHYVTRQQAFLLNGEEKLREVIVGSARSAKRAKQLAEEYRKTDPTAGWRAAHEYSDEVPGAQAGSGYDLANRFITTRRDEAIVDLDSGVSRLLSVEATLERMIHTSSTQAGVGVWADVNLMRLRKAYPRTDFNLLKGDVPMANIPDAEREAVRRTFNSIRRMLGVDTSTGSSVASGLRHALADRILDLQRYADSDGWQQFITAVGKEVAGEGGKTLRALKSATAVAYLTLNPARQFVMNTMLIPQYFGIAGAGSYLVKGEFIRDMSLLAAHMMGGERVAMATAKALLMSENYARKLIDDFNQSGLAALADGHVFTMDTLGSGRTVGRTWAGQAAANTINQMDKIGVKAGINIDKRAAFLISRRRFEVLNGRGPAGRRELSEVASFAENELTLGQSRADIGPLQKGWLGLLLQFQSYTIKASGRLIDQAKAVLPESARKAMGIELRAGTLTANELRRMAAINMVVAGAAGYGLVNISAKIADDLGIDIPDDIKPIIDEGIFSYLMSAAFGLIDEDEGKDTKLALSETFSPFGFAVNTVRGMTSWLKAGAAAGTMGDFDIPAMSVPSFGLAAGLVDTFRLGWALGLNPAVTKTEALQVTLEKSVRLFPLVNNAMKGLSMMNTGYSVDGKGRPTTRASLGEAAARIALGARTEEEAGYYDLLASRYGMKFNADDKGGDAVALQEQVDSDWAVLEAVLIGQPNTPIRLERAEEMINTLSTSREAQLSHEFGRYQRMMQRKASALLEDRPRSELLVTRMIEELTNRQRLPDPDYLSSIKDGRDFQGKQELVDYLTGMVNYSPVDLD